MAKQPETAYEWLERYEKRYQKAVDNYQNTGEARYDRQVWEYDCICAAFRALIEKKEEQGVDMKKRLANCNWTIEQLINPSYTREEVIKMLRTAVYW